jgi:hypothetical protein
MMETLGRLLYHRLFSPLWAVLYYWNSQHFFYGLPELYGFQGKSNASICAHIRHGEEHEYQYLHRDMTGNLILTHGHQPNPTFLPTPLCNGILENVVVSRTMLVCTLLVVLAMWWLLKNATFMISSVSQLLTWILCRCYGIVSSQERQAEEEQKQKFHWMKKYHQGNENMLRAIATIVFEKNLSERTAMDRIATIRDFYGTVPIDAQKMLRIENQVAQASSSCAVNANTAQTVIGTVQTHEVVHNK